MKKPLMTSGGGGLAHTQTRDFSQSTRGAAMRAKEKCSRNSRRIIACARSLTCDDPALRGLAGEGGGSHTRMSKRRSLSVSPPRAGGEDAGAAGHVPGAVLIH